MNRLALGSASISLLWLLGTSVAWGVDGVIEINQAAAIAGGVTAGDAPGFPVTLDSPGSYRLTGNLTSPITTGAISITASNVTIDLGGFLISSTNVCTGYPVASCNVQGGAPGISSGSQVVVVRNGSVRSMGGRCVDLQGSAAVVEEVAVTGCGSTGISVGRFSRVARSISDGNYEDGIDVAGGGATAEGNEVRGNFSYGINMSGGLGGIVMANRAYENASAGIFVSSGTALVTRNVATGNVGLPIQLQSPAKSLGDNLCSGVQC